MTDHIRQGIEGYRTERARHQPQSWRGDYAGSVTSAWVSPESAAISATAFVWRDPLTIPPRPWVYGRHMIR